MRDSIKEERRPKAFREFDFSDDFKFPHNDCQGDFPLQRQAVLPDLFATGCTGELVERMPLRLHKLSADTLIVGARLTSTVHPGVTVAYLADEGITAPSKKRLGESTTVGIEYPQLGRTIFPPHPTLRCH